MLMIFACIGEAIISLLMFHYGNRLSGVLWGGLSFMHFMLVLPIISKFIKKMKEKKREKA